MNVNYIRKRSTKNNYSEYIPPKTDMVSSFFMYTQYFTLLPMSEHKDTLIVPSQAQLFLSLS